LLLPQFIIALVATVVATVDCFLFNIIHFAVLCSFPRALAHGSLKYGRLKLLNLHTKQTIVQIQQVLASSLNSNTIAFLLHICGKYMHCWRTISDTASALRADHKLLDNTYLDDFSTFEYFSSIRDPQSCSAPTRDNELMHLYISHGFHNVLDLIILNHGQMYLWAFWVSDICTSSGDRIEMHIWNNPQPLPSKQTWLQLEKPSSGDWILLKKALSTGLHLTQNQQLAIPLGLWSNLGTNKGWFFKPQSDCLWFAHNSTWLLHNYVPYRTRTKVFT